MLGFQHRGIPPRGGAGGRRSQTYLPPPGVLLGGQRLIYPRLGVRVRGLFLGARPCGVARESSLLSLSQGHV
jgi:hypothetical protein